MMFCPRLFIQKKCQNITDIILMNFMFVFLGFAVMSTRCFRKAKKRNKPFILTNANNKLISKKFFFNVLIRLFKNKKQTEKETKVFLLPFETHLIGLPLFSREAFADQGDVLVVPGVAIRQRGAATQAIDLIAVVPPAGAGLSFFFSVGGE